MPTPTPRTRITIGRGTFANLQASVDDLAEGEIVLATDQDKVYAKLNGALVLITTDDAVTSVNGKIGDVVLDAADVGAATTAQGVLADSALQPGEAATPAQGALADTALQPGEAATPAQGALADSALQSGDDISELTNDAGYITAGDVPAAPVTSVAGKTGVVTLQLDDLTDWDAADYATAAQGTLADSALQAGDNVSELANDAGYITAGDIPAPLVTSVAGKTGAVTLVKGDVGLGNVDNTSDADKPISVATQSALDNKADLVGGVVPNSQLPSIAISEYLGTAADQAAMLALNGQEGDWCIRTDTSSTWVVTGSDSSQLSSWTELATPADLVTSVNGFQGAVVLSAADVGAIPAADQYWQRAGATISPLNSGDSLDVDGSGSFGSFVKSDDGAGNTSALTNTGVNSVRDTADVGKKVWSGYGGSTETSTINSDGSATFASGVVGQSLRTDASGGQVTANYNLVTEDTNVSLGLFIGCTDSGNATTANSNASITGDGSASFSGVVDGLQFIANQTGGGFVASRSTDGLQVWRAGSNDFDISDPSTYTSEIMSDGSASFSGDISANNTNFSGQMIANSVYVDSPDDTQTVYLGGGSATAALYTYTKSPATTGIQLNWDGSAVFPSYVTAGNGTVSLAANTGITVNDGAIDLYQATSSATAQPLTISSDIGGIDNEVFRVNADGYSSGTGYNSYPTNSGFSGLTVTDPDNGTTSFDVRGDGEVLVSGGYNATLGGVSIFNGGGIISGRAAAESTSYVWQGHKTGTGVTSEITGDGDFSNNGAIRAGNAVASGFTTGFIMDPAASGGSYFQIYTNNAVTNNVLSVYNGDNATRPFSLSPSGTIDAGMLEVTAQNLSQGTSRLKISQENSGKSQLRAYGPDASTAGELEFRVSSNDASVDSVPLTLTSNGDSLFSGTATFAGRVNCGGDSSTTLNNHAVAAYNNSTPSQGIASIFATNRGNGRLLDLRNASDSIMLEMESNGNLAATGTVSAQGSVLTSDQRFKENVTDAHAQLKDVVALGNSLRNWDWSEDAPVADKDTRFLGLIAQETEQICPGIVTTISKTKQGELLTPERTLKNREGEVVKTIPATYEEIDDSYKAIKNDVLTMKLLGAVAELTAKVEELEAEVKALKQEQD